MNEVRFAIDCPRCRRHIQYQLNPVHTPSRAEMEAERISIHDSHRGLWVEDSTLSVRSRNGLHALGIGLFDELHGMPIRQLYRVHHIGKVSVAEILHFVAEPKEESGPRER